MGQSSITLEFENIRKELTNDVQKILSDSKDDFRKCVSEEVHRSVYPAYSPDPDNYQRRMDEGGLSDEGNYEVIEGNLSLTLTNKTASNPNYWKYSYSVPITELVENATGDGWKGVPERPFMDNALDRFAHEILEPRINALGGGK